MRRFRRVEVKRVANVGAFVFVDLRVWGSGRLLGEVLRHFEGSELHQPIGGRYEANFQCVGGSRGHVFGSLQSVGYCDCCHSLVGVVANRL